MSNITTIDIIILSYAKTEELKALTTQSIETLLLSEDPEKIRFNILVIESNKNLLPYQFEHSRTIYPEEKFGFHRYLNIGIKATANEYVCLCNNDLIFHKGWASEILRLMSIHPEIKSVNPLCSDFEPTKKYHDSLVVHANKRNMFNGILTGWCIFVKREIFNKIGLLDEQFEFWYADRDYGMTLLKYNISHALSIRSLVTHIGNQSHNTLDLKFDHFTEGQRIKYQKKWEKDFKWSFKRILIKFKNAL